MLPYGPFRELRGDDFKQHDFSEGTLVGKLHDSGYRGVNPNESVPGRFAKINQVSDITSSFSPSGGYSKTVKDDRISTAEELFEAGNSRAANRAGKNIDEGREAYLFNLELHSFDMHPFASVNDVMVEKRGDCIGLDLGGKLPVYVTPDTLIVWRG